VRGRPVRGMRAVKARHFSDRFNRESRGDRMSHRAG
jgi:hypothetical protein